MSADHQQLPLDQARDGMVLSSDLHDDHGVVLLVRGTTLNANILKSLARHGIETVPVKRAAGEAASEPDPDQLRARLSYLFRLENCNEASSILHQYVESYRFGGAA